MKTETLTQILEFSEKTFSEGEHLEVSNSLKRIYEKTEDEDDWMNFTESVKIYDHNHMYHDIEITHFNSTNTELLYRFNICGKIEEGNIEKLKRKIYLYLKGSCDSDIKCSDLYCCYNFKHYLDFYGYNLVDTVDLENGIPANTREFIDEFYKYFVENILPTILESKITLEN